MKNVVIFWLILITITSYPMVILADDIPLNKNIVERCARVVNLDFFPDISLVGVITDTIAGEDIIFEINNNECLSKGYKLNNLDIYWNTKDNPTQINPNNLLFKNFDTHGDYIDNSNYLVKQDVDYSVLKTINHELVLLNTKVISEYNNGIPKKIEYFDVEKPINDTLSNNFRISKDLKIGIKKDEEVKYLQIFLNKTLNLSLLEDGSFGNKTKSAVIIFQKSNNLIPDGIVGTMTRERINEF